MASLKKRGKTYYAQYYVNGEQKRANLYTALLQIAKEKLRQIEAAQLRQKDVPLPTKTPVPEILEKYFFHLSARTSERNVQKVATYLRATFGSICDSLKIKNKKIVRKYPELSRGKDLKLTLFVGKLCKHPHHQDAALKAPHAKG